MLFSELISYFEKLEATSSRLALMDILADLFKHSPATEIDKIVYLTQGRIAPFFEATEIGMAEKQVAASIAIAYNLTKQEVLKLYGKLGDMGETAIKAHEEFVKKGKIQKSLFISKTKKMTVTEVFEILTQIAKTSGEGTVEKRQNLLSNLLENVGGKSIKYLVRIPLGDLRLGVGDPTVLDGMALAKLGDKTKRKLLEGAYNRTSDLGLIAKTLWEKGLEGVVKLQVVVGKPIRSELCERLPNAEKVIEKMGTVDAQPKYDGFRVQIHKDGDKISMFSRNLENMTHMFPELIEGARKQIKAKTAILDTEALAYNPESEEFLPFQETTKRRRKHNIEEVAKSLPLKAFVFDVLYKDGKSLIDTPLKERLKIVREMVEKGDVLIAAKTQEISDPKVLSLMLEDSISKGLEGVVIKKVDSFYEAGGRSFNWVKLKRNQSGELNDTVDCVVLGYVFGKGKRTAFGAGALLVGIYDDKKDEFVTVSKIGTGLSDEEWKSIKQRTKNLELRNKPARVNSLITPSVWVQPEIVIEVLADEITRSPIHTAGATLNKENGTENKEPGYALRFPRLVSFRNADKKPEDATTVKELIEMFNQQGRV